MKFLRRLKNYLSSELARDLEIVYLRMQVDQIMKQLDEDEKNAETEEERREIADFKRKIVEEGERVRAGGKPTCPTVSSPEKDNR